MAFEIPCGRWRVLNGTDWTAACCIERERTGCIYKSIVGEIYNNGARTLDQCKIAVNQHWYISHGLYYRIDDAEGRIYCTNPTCDVYMNMDNKGRKYMSRQMMQHYEKEHPVEHSIKVLLLKEPGAEQPNIQADTEAKVEKHSKQQEQQDKGKGVLETSELQGESSNDSEALLARINIMEQKLEEAMKEIKRLKAMNIDEDFWGLRLTRHVQTTESMFYAARVVDGENVPFFVYKSDERSWEAELKPGFCPEPKADNSRCNVKCYIGIDACQDHLKSVCHVNINYSSIQGAGLGLFAWDPLEREGHVVFQANDCILEYRGEKISNIECDARYGKGVAPYGLGTREKVDIFDDQGTKIGESTAVLDAALERYAASLANGSRGNITRNASFRGVFLVAVKNICHKEEIIVSYGLSYWKKTKGVQETRDEDKGDTSSDDSRGSPKRKRMQG